MYTLRVLYIGKGRRCHEQRLSCQNDAKGETACKSHYALGHWSPERLDGFKSKHSQFHTASN